MTAEKVYEWITAPFWANENTALRAEGFITIDVDVYDDKHGDETLARLEEELGELPVTITSTARGADSPSRQHFYRLPPEYVDARFVTAFDSIEVVQRTHRYAIVAPSVHPSSGQPYVWYAEDGEPLAGLPSLDDFEMLPERWLQRLVVPDVDRNADDGVTFGGRTVSGRPVAAHVAFDGGIADWMAACPEGEPGGFLRELVTSARAAQGKIGHDQMRDFQHQLVKLATEGEPGVPWALREFRALYTDYPDTSKDWGHEFDTALASGIAKAGGFPKRPDDIRAADHLPLMGAVDLGLYTSLPEGADEDPVFARRRVAFIASLALQHGHSEFEAAVLAWNSKAAIESIRRDADEGVAAVWAIVRQVAEAPISEEDEPTPSPETPSGGSAPAPVELLTAPERAKLAGWRAELATRGQYAWWGDEFMAVMSERRAIITESYYRLNRWMILSLIFASKAHIPLEDDDNARIILNIYGIIVGPSGTGKSESLEPVHAVNKTLGADSPDIGGNATVGGLIEKLIERDGLSSFFHADEADKILRDWSNDKGEFRGMKQGVTDLYGGRVPAILRATKKEISGIHAVAYLNVHLTGVLGKVADAIEPEDWESGFVNRFVFAVGERKPRTRESKRIRVRRTAAAGGKGPEWTQKWMMQFMQAVRRIERGDGEMAEIDFEDAVLDRHVDLQEALEKRAAKSPYRDRLEPTFTRFHVTVLKCAALVALSGGELVVRMSHYLLALEQAEEWLANALMLVEMTDESPRVRRIDRLAGHIADAGGQMRLTSINRLKGFRGESREVQSLIGELVAQGRAVTENDQFGGGEIVRLRKEAA